MGFVASLVAKAIGALVDSIAGALIDAWKEQRLIELGQERQHAGDLANAVRTIQEERDAALTAPRGPDAVLASMQRGDI